MFDKMKNLMEMKKQADTMKKELDRSTMECTDVRGIKIVINGAQMIQQIEIDESWLAQANKQKIEMNMLRAVNAAITKSQKMAAKQMRNMMPEGFPGL
ncbi:MAG: YbaB/EbfC family nucleoid-associated protein [Candidatus Omnitrophica bacterium]|nr:YbaB/EbfC family nucleoid-associated protein [Candidatus Omnitrophota bacterium]